MIRIALLTALWAPSLLAGPAQARDVNPSVARTVPGPLPTTPFVLPSTSSVTLSNGVVLTFVENDEVPTFDLRAVLAVGTAADPVGAEGLTEITFALLDDGTVHEGTALDAAGIARRAKLLGGAIGAGAGRDGASVSVSGLSRSMAPLVALWASVLRHPTYAEDVWNLERTHRIAEYTADLDRPNRMADRALAHLAWGEGYAAREATPQTLAGLTPDALKAWHGRVVQPGAMRLFASGDVDPRALVAQLEAAFAGWSADAAPPVVPPPTPAAPAGGRIYLIDKPGAAQSVLSTVQVLARPTEPDWHALLLANTALGGAFTARINLNLREDKGYTYGARCGLGFGVGPAVWSCSANVATDVTAPALTELRRELVEALDARPLTEQEIRFFRDYRTRSFKGSFERPGTILDELATEWLSGLPSDWLSRYVPALTAVTAESANEALRGRLALDAIAWVVVGDAAKIRPSLEATGLDIVLTGRDGRPVESP
jgi:zinc protease